MIPTTFILQIDASGFSLIDAEKLIKSLDWTEFFKATEGRKCMMSIGMIDEDCK